MALGVAASVAVMLAVGVGLIIDRNEPKDTFTDPYLAYLEVEKAFARMSDSMQKGLDMAEESQQIVEKATSILRHFDEE